jgi:hypothetical protein
MLLIPPQAWEKQMQSAMQHRSAEPNSVMDDEDNGEQVERDSVAPRQKMLVHAMLGGILRKYWG